MTTDMPDAVIEAPRSPPTKACEDEDGMPIYQVMRFQTIAPIRAANITSRFKAVGSNSPAPTVFATATPNKNGPLNSPIAVMVRAARGFIAREEITVATIFELSWSPFRKSKMRERTIMAISIIYRRVWKFDTITGAKKMEVELKIQKSLNDFLQIYPGNPLI